VYEDYEEDLGFVHHNHGEFLSGAAAEQLLDSMESIKIRSQNSMDIGYD